MNKLDKLMERFDEVWEKEFHGEIFPNTTVKQFLTDAIAEVLESLTDDNSLKDKNNGRYNREIELREQIKKWLK